MGLAASSRFLSADFEKNTVVDQNERGSHESVQLKQRFTFHSPFHSLAPRET